MSRITRRINKNLLFILDRLYKKTRTSFAIRQKLSYDDFFVYLPPDHLLPDFQKGCKKYDRFLPVLARHLANDATVIDVGANCGDTLGAMINSNSAVHYVCIEPDDAFFKYLELNISLIKKARPNASILPIKALVGHKVQSACLEGVGGTKHAVCYTTTESSLCSQSLDEIVSNLDLSKIQLLKSDTDGFDFDVIDSAADLIRSHKPMLFFECEYRNESQKHGYESTIARLESAGYQDWTVFDNFGEIILRTNDISILTQLVNYIWAQNTQKTVRTIYYYDILATPPTTQILLIMFCLIIIQLTFLRHKESK